jgi:hypothetical protein
MNAQENPRRLRAGGGGGLVLLQFSTRMGCMPIGTFELFMGMVLPVMVRYCLYLVWTVYSVVSQLPFWQVFDVSQIAFAS